MIFDKIYRINRGELNSVQITTEGLNDTEINYIVFLNMKYNIMSDGLMYNYEEIYNNTMKIVRVYNKVVNFDKIGVVIRISNIEFCYIGRGIEYFMKRDNLICMDFSSWVVKGILE